MQVKVNERTNSVVGTEFCCGELADLGAKGCLVYEVNPEMMFGVLADGPGDKMKVPFGSCPYCGSETEFTRVEGGEAPADPGYLE